MTPALALGVSLVVSIGARLARALTGGGAVAAAIVGFIVLWATGWPGGAVLAVFFVGSTLVGRLGATRPSASDARGEQRDAVQVLANGSAGAVGALGELVAPGLGLWMLTGALATAAADTWATAIGALSPNEPVSLLGRFRVPRGTSGGVSWIGTLGALGGALSVAGTAALVGADRALLPVGFAIGVAGMLFDSLLGASVQARFVCPACNVFSERPLHHCGRPTRVRGGWRWLDNDTVNAFATLAGGMAAGLVWSLN